MKNEFDCLLDFLRANLAALIAESRDNGLKPKQYKELLSYLPAIVKIFRKHSKYYGRRSI